MDEFIQFTINTNFNEPTHLKLISLSTEEWIFKNIKEISTMYFGLGRIFDNISIRLSVSRDRI